MNRRSGDRRRQQRNGIYSAKTQIWINGLTLVVSLVSLVIALTRHSTEIAASSVEAPVVEEKVEEVVVQPAPIVEKNRAPARSKIDPKKTHSKERVSRGPKRVKIVFEESVARAPASVAPVESGPKTIKYSNDLYEKEDLL